jgi:hypothetical protein
MMKRSLLALAIGLAFLTAGVASAEQQKPVEKKAACCATKSADGSKACAHEAKAASCCKGEQSKSCCPADCCGSHKDKPAAGTNAKRSDGDQKSASCCAGGSCCKSESC